MITSLLDNIQNLISLDQGEKDLITSLFKEKRYTKGDFFLAEGQICKHVGFITQGLMRYYINHDGEEKTYSNYFVQSFRPDLKNFLKNLELPLQLMNFFLHH
jgi:hypothetical protein